MVTTERDTETAPTAATEPTAATTTPTTTTTIVVCVDGSPPSRRAIDWCARHAHGLRADTVVVVHAVHLPHYAPFAELGPALTVPVMGACERARIRALVTDQWCRPLRDADIAHEVLLLEGAAANVLPVVAEREHASLAVAGRDAFDQLSQLVLASALGCPLVVIP